MSQTHEKKMSRRDKLRGIFGRSGRSTPALPVDNSTSRSHQSTSSIRTLSTSVPNQQSGPTPTSLDGTSRNTVLQRAIDEYLDTISDSEKDDFRAAAQSITDHDVLEQVKSFDQKHSNESSFRPHTKSLSRLLGLLGRLTDAVTIGIQANPDISSIVVGIARGMITIATSFVGFFEKLSTMLTRISDFLDPLMKYAELEGTSKLVQDCLVNVYIDVLKFFRASRKVFVDAQGKTRQLTSWRVFCRNQWIPFEDEFGAIEADLKHHLDVLLQAGSVQMSRDEHARRHRELANERETFLNWLSDYDYEGIHSTIYAKKHPDTGRWLLETPEFTNWLANPKSQTLWCHGKAGAGKSVLASNVIEYISSRYQLDDQTSIAYVYYDYQAAEMQKDKFLFSALIKQICRRGKTPPQSFLNVKLDALSSGQLANADSIMLAAEHYGLKRIFIVIDALDECPKLNRPGVLESLRRLFDIGSAYQLKLFITSRREMDIEEAFARWQSPRILIEARNIETDIHRYVQDEVKRLREERMLFINDPALTQQVIHHLTTNADGMFLWVDLQLRHLCEQSESHVDQDVRAALQALPEDLEKTYQRSLDRIFQNKTRRDLALTVLRWTVYSCRRLTVEELWGALAVELPGTKLPESTEDGNRFLTSICANLLEISEQQLIRPIHYSVQEFLIASQNSHIQGRLLNALVDRNEIHSRLAIVCIDYLLLVLRDKSPADDSFDLNGRLYVSAFLWYAAQYFDVHMEESSWCHTAVKKCNTLLQCPSKFLAAVLQVRRIRGCQGYPAIPNTYSNFAIPMSQIDVLMVIFSTRLYHSSEFAIYWKDKELSTSLLHFACTAESSEAIEHLLIRGIDVNARDDSGASPVYLSSLSGNYEAVRLLLNHGADVDTQCCYYGTALQAASYEGHTRVVQLLLRAAAKDILCGHYGTALQAASAGGYREIVQELLDAGADVNAQGGHYGTALQAASVGGHREIVQTLLDVGANMNAQGGYYGTALQAASAEGHKEIVQTLLGVGAEVDVQGGFYGTALQAASAEGHKGIVQTLLDIGADVNAQGGHFGTALQAASAEGHKEIVQTLLDVGADVNIQGDRYGTALQAASAWGHREIVQTLLDVGADLNAQGGYFGTALQAASAGENREIVQTLLDAGVNVNAQGGHFGTALQAASARGYREIIQTLLDVGANVNAQGGAFGTALQAASAEGHKEIVQTLLDIGADVNAQGGHYGTALQAASAKGHKEVVQILLQAGAEERDPGGDPKTSLDTE